MSLKKSIPLNIAFVSTYDVFRAADGIGRVISDFANWLVAKGQHCSIYVPKVTGSFFGLSRNIEFRQYGQEGVPLLLERPVINFSSLFSRTSSRRRFFRHMSESARWSWQLSELLLQYPRIDVAIARCPFDGIVAVKAFQKIGQKVPVIAMVHTPCERVIEQIYPQLRGNKNTSIEVALRRDGLWANHLEISNLIAEFHATQFLLPTACEQFVQLFPKSHVTIIPNIVPQYSSLASSTNPKLVCVGRVAPGKRPDLLIRAFALICQKFPEWHLEFWGSTGDKRFTQTIKDLIERLQLSRKVFLCGETREIEKVLASSSVFVFPSLREGWGLALTEAMSAGLAVLGCNDAPGVRDLIQNGENGLLCEPTQEAMSNALAKLLSDVSLRRKLGKEAKHSVCQYTADNVWSQWESLIMEAVSTNESVSVS